MNRPSVVSSSFRGFVTKEASETPTTKRYGVSRSHNNSSSSSYPRIPRRSSSLTASVTDGCCEPASSTRTPSLSDSNYQIQVLKVRRPGRPDINSSKIYCLEDPFLEKTPRPANNSQRHFAANPQVLIRWSSGSWNASRPYQPSELGGSRADSKPDMDPTSHPLLRPMDLPIACVKVRASTSLSYIGKEPTSLWATVYISGDVSPMLSPGASSIAPLDIIILLDALQQPSSEFLSQINLASFVLANHITHRHDRIALAYVDGRSNQGFEVLLPLGFHSIEAIRSALKSFSRFASKHKVSFELGDVFHRVSCILLRSPRNAFPHLFFVSATPPDHLEISNIDHAIGFHTITPHPSLPLDKDNPSYPSGWHISYTVGASDTGPRETHFIRRISRVIQQIRTGIRAGSIDDLKISIAPGYGCEIQSAFESINLKSLRPGETWSIPVHICVPNAALRRKSQIAQTGSSSEHPLIYDMMSRLDCLLQDFTSNEIIQPLLKAHVEYRHSLLPEPSTVHVDSHLTIIRRIEVDMGASEGSVRGSMEGSAQYSDYSLSMGSLSDLS
ncbi:hypothetical protein N7466_001240 [Penicillium verhagenii]|uniref:uncharacterized protein n=1 Tax=Penicillium verhagenii TaxID=1562060 RepID=UPI0025454FB6|nr:uncharacterized protein N7466_001240 [Penicillium verhagenii]KAJ5948225.1 hypothetical protein N7466_001240 [Penicillium verhagenii]